MIKRISGVLLALTVLMSLLPTAYAAGETVITHDVDQIRELLRSDGDVTIQLDANAEKELTAYSDFESEKWNGSQYIWTIIGSGKKVLDLNGHRMYVYDRSASALAEPGHGILLDFRYISKALMMKIPTGASLTVEDATDDGLIWMDAEMPPKSELRGGDLMMERNIFAVTGGNLTINGGEIHAGRSKDIYANQATKTDKEHRLIYNLAGLTTHLCGYATWFLSGTAINVSSGNVTVNGGDIWGRGWDNWTLITRVPGAPNGADDFRDRCAALRVSGGTAVINGGSFHGRSDADAVQVSNPKDLKVKAGSFDVGTNTWLVEAGLDLYDFFSGSISQNLDDAASVACFDAVEGYLGSPAIPALCIDEQSDAVGNEKTVTVKPLGQGATPYLVVGDIGVWINSPLAYETPTDTVYNVPDGCTVQSVTWYEDGKMIENAGSTYFKEGKSYYVKITLATEAGAKFKNDLSDATVNGRDAALSRKNDGSIVLTAHFGTCIAALESVALTADTPKDGYSPSNWIDCADEAYYASGNYFNYMDYRKWYVSDDGISGWTEMSYDDTYVAGKYYRLSAEIRAGEGQEFAVNAGGISVQPNISATVNGRKAAVSKVYDEDPSECVTVTCDFGVCPAIIDHIELSTLYPPTDGETVRYTVSAESDAYEVVGQTGSHYDDYVQWYVSDSGLDGTWTKLNRGAKFQSGKYYRLYVDVHTRGGYEFFVRDLDTIEPYVSANVNGYYANVIKTYEQDPSEYVTVVFDFGVCNDGVIERIEIVDVTPPVAGEKPSYTYNILGTGYQMNIAKNAYEDIYWTNPPQKLYYVKNGLQWWDTTTGSWDYVYENDTFIPGHTYACQVNLLVDNGYHFRNMSEHGQLPMATVNGYSAQINDGWTNATEARVYYTFTCVKKDVSEIYISDLDMPQEGKKPDYTVTLGGPELYRLDTNYGMQNSGIYWYDCEDTMLDEGDTFRGGERYKLEMKLIPTQTGGVDNAQFVSPVKVYVNGEEVYERLNWDAVYASKNAVYIYYTFFRGASAALEGTESVLGAWSGEKLTISATAPVGGRLIASEYDSDGRQVRVWAATLSASIAEQNVDPHFTKTNGHTYKVMLIGKSTYTPLCEAWVGKA